MSTQSENTGAPQLPDAQTAYATIINTVAADAFFEKLAEYGIRPQNEAEARELMTIGLHLQQASTNEKQASANPYAIAREALDQELVARNLLTSQETNVAETNRVKAAAWQYAQNPEIFSAVVALAAAQG